jgi:hypothetical protein
VAIRFNPRTEFRPRWRDCHGACAPRNDSKLFAAVPRLAIGDWRLATDDS